MSIKKIFKKGQPSNKLAVGSDNHDKNTVDRRNCKEERS